MTRAERALRKAERLEMQGNARAARATNREDALSRAAIRGGQAADRAWREAAAIRAAVKERAAAGARETGKRKLTREWWRKGVA